MEKPVLSAEERLTNSSFELPERVTTRASSFGAANAAIREAWTRTSRISCGSDVGSWDLAHETGGHCMPLRHLRMYLERTRQKRKALHMLALSGVIRPSHVELRYAIPLLNIEDQFSAFQEKPVTAVRPSGFLQKVFELMRWLARDDGSSRQYLSGNNQLKFRESVSACIRSSP
jgi:hypothetical protein